MLAIKEYFEHYEILKQDESNHHFTVVQKGSWLIIAKSEVQKDYSISERGICIIKAIENIIDMKIITSQRT